MDTQTTRAAKGHSPTTTPLALRDVTVAYGQHVAAWDVTLHVAPGELLCLAGPNGAGKTTLLRVASGTLAPAQGEALLFGTPVGLLPPRERARRVAVVGQTPTLPPGFTARDVVLMGRTPHVPFLRWEGPSDYAAAGRAMALARCAHLAHRPVLELSGGERQRVLVARALAQETPLLLLDEPTAHLDLASQVDVLATLRRAQRETGLTVVAAVHDLTLAARFSDRVALLHQGRLVTVGAPAQVLTPQTLSQVYGTPVAVLPHPMDGSPVVLPVGGGTHDDTVSDLS